MSRILIGLPMLAAAALAQAAGSAFPVSPQRTTVVANETQVISARFFDAQGRAAAGETVRFFNDACGTFPGGGFVGSATSDATGLASINFTALNLGFIRCTVSAAALTSGGAVSFDVMTFRPDMTTITISTTTDPVEPRPGQGFRVTATPRFGQFPLANAKLDARIVAGTASASLPASTFITGQDGAAQFNVT